MMASVSTKVASRIQTYTIIRIYICIYIYIEAHVSLLMWQAMIYKCMDYIGAYSLALIHHKRLRSWFSKQIIFVSRQLANFNYSYAPGHCIICLKASVLKVLANTKSAYIARPQIVKYFNQLRQQSGSAKDKHISYKKMDVSAGCRVLLVFVVLSSTFALPIDLGELTLTSTEISINARLIYNLKNLTFVMRSGI